MALPGTTTCSSRAFRMTKMAMKRRSRATVRQEPFLTRVVIALFSFVRLAEFEILFFLFVLIALLIFKDLTSRPKYNQIFVKKPDGEGFWPF
ncbi:hypothetical protein Cni_G28682 [Canna indica]|uniref:Uncharacterized protein n=1 Tax=Canna indica TaxID=4628 RepID=A0AAQ3L4C5_9LILI|nr:hypothetical protein Cni_G28682 [Canna indica]